MPTVIQTGSGERIMKTAYLPTRVYRAIEDERTKDPDTRIPFTALVAQLLEEALVARGILKNTHGG